MKRFVSIMTACLLLSIAMMAPAAFAEENKPQKRYPVKEEHGADLYMLNYSKYIHYGFYLSVLGQAAQYRKGWGGMIGGRAAIMVDTIFAIGAGYQLSIATPLAKIGGTGNGTERARALLRPPEKEARIAYGGGYIAYHIFSDKIANFSLGALGGWGHLGRDYAGGPGSTFYFLEPELYVYINLPKYARIGAGASYRISWGARYRGITDRDFRGFSIGLSVQAGLLQ